MKNSVWFLLLVFASASAYAVSGSPPPDPYQSTHNSQIAPAPGNPYYEVPDAIQDAPVQTPYPGNAANIRENQTVNNVGLEYGADLCKNVTVTNIPQLTGPPLGDGSLLQLGDNPGTGATANDLEVFVPKRSEQEWRCFIGGVDIDETDGVTLADCTGPGPQPPNGAVPHPTLPNVWRASCDGGGSNCWTQTASCPDQTTLMRVRGFMNTEYQSTASSFRSVHGTVGDVWNKVTGYRWGQVRMRCGRLGDDRTSLVGNIDGYQCSESVQTRTVTFSNPNQTQFTFGCRDDDNSCSGPDCGCFVAVEYECTAPGSNNNNMVAGGPTGPQFGLPAGGYGNRTPNGGEICR